MLGARISNFEVVRLLGEGGMGAVYEAKHPLIEKRVAIKLLKPERSVDPELVPRFLNEARATSAIRHPNIVDVMDLGTLPSGAPYLVMELLEGETLGDRLERVGKLPLSVALDFACQTASALEAAHARGIVHRDLKPDNVFLVADPRVPGRELVKVLDFGIAKLRGELATAPVDTIAGAVLGTPSYMSPEQCRGVPEALDHRTDIYALGVMLYEMICGTPPFVAEGLGDTMMMHMSVPPAPPSTVGAELPEEVEHTILRALAKRPEDRFSSMAELRAALERRASPAVVVPAAAPINAERYFVQMVTAGARSGALARTDEPSRIEPARSASSRDADDEDTTLRTVARAAPRTHGVAVAGLVCLLLGGAGWLLQDLALAGPAGPATRARAAAPPARDPVSPPPPAADVRVPMTAVLPEPLGSVQYAQTPPSTAEASTAAERTARRSTRNSASSAKARTNRRAEAEADTANAFATVAARTDWQAAPADPVAAAAPAAPAASSATSEPLAVESLARLEDQPKTLPAGSAQLVAAAPEASEVSDALAAARRAMMGAKSAPPPPRPARGVSITGLRVQGPLPESVVRRGIERVRPRFERCFQTAAASAPGGDLGRIAVSFELDELGRAANARAVGSTLAQLDRCVADAMRGVSSRHAPDTGIVRGSFELAPVR